MRVAVYYNNNDIRLEERPKPSIGPGELLIQTKSSGICGSDVMEWYRIDRIPLVLGHEISGVVVEAGEGITNFKTGDRIAASHHVPCNTCHYCLGGNHTVCETLRTTNFDPGGFAEYIRLPAINVDRGVYKLPDEVSFDEATFIEPLACVIRGQRKAQLKPGQSVLILGSGISGLLHLMAAKAIGVGKIFMTDMDEFRLEQAKQLGATAAFHAGDDVAKLVREHNQGRGADRIILTTGAPQAMEQALNSVDRGGIVLFFAPAKDDGKLSILVNHIFWKHEATLTSTYAASPADHWISLEMIANKRVDPKNLITHRLKLEETLLGFQLTEKPKNSLKVLIQPNL
jgi:L-iditol 2-dehydrogenase